MPYDAHTRLTMSGDFLGTTGPLEIWSWGLKFGALGSGSASTTEDLAAAATTVANAWTSTIAARHMTHVRLTRVRVGLHAAGGLTQRLADGGYQHGDWEGTKPGTATGGVRTPLQTSVVVSLRTPRAGASGKGRVFLPQVNSSVDDNYSYSAVACQQTADAFAAFLEAIRPAVGQARVYSTKGGNSPVLSVAVGSVPDTQRSRRSAMPEAYTERVLAAFP